MRISKVVQVNIKVTRLDEVRVLPARSRSIQIDARYLGTYGQECTVTAESGIWKQ